MTVGNGLLPFPFGFLLGDEAFHPVCEIPAAVGRVDQIAVVGNAIAGVTGTPIRETNNSGLDNVILGNVIPIPASAVSPIESSPSCRLHAIDNDGRVRCEP